MNEGFRGAQCLIGEGMVHGAPLSSMCCVVDTNPSRHNVDITMVYFVAYRLFDIRLIIVDCFKATRSIYQDTIRGDAKG